MEQTMRAVLGGSALGVAGLVAGLLIGRSLWSGGGAEPTPSDALAQTVPPQLTATDTARVEDAVAAAGDRRSVEHDAGLVRPSATRDAVASTDSGVFSGALLALAREGILDGWRVERKDQPSSEEVDEGMVMFRERTLFIPAAIGRELAKRRSAIERAAEDAQRGGVFGTLERLQSESVGPMTEVVLDRGTFEKFFRRGTVGSTISAATALATDHLRKREPVADGSTLTFPAGVWSLPDFGSYWRKHMPRDLTLRGAGKAHTLLVLRSDLSAYDTVRNLAFEDCTIHTNNNYLFDVRQPPMSVILRRVRITGWDMGAGSSCLFGTEGLALHAIDCEFLGGYGRAPRYGQLFDVRHDGLVARFDRCTISNTYAFRHFGAGATVVFSVCELRDLYDNKERIPKGVTLEACNTTFAKSSEAEKRDLDDLFRGWEAELQRKR